MAAFNLILGKPIGLRAFVVMLAVVIISACAQVPITGRSGLHLVPDSELATMSFQEYRAVLEKSRLSADVRQTAMVRQVGMRIAKAAETFLQESGHQDAIADYHWEFNLIQDDKTVNAWVMPGGKAAVYTGILPYTRDETGLAVVLGHEVGHALAGHGNERLSQGLLTQLGGAALAVALQRQPQLTQTLFMEAYGVGTSVGFLLPYSRLHESEADRIGLTLMARAGYDPREAVPFWQRMQAQEQSRPPEFLSTHPAPDTRIRDIQSHLAEALPYYQKAIR
ncbi:MAG: M48 family metallopeptidase [Desulfobacteraceae bacterium]|jgi:predicted Zn-dependent protease|nr:M48 family metallopeptidase [Desulfobacteraceae bacterium]